MYVQEKTDFMTVPGFSKRVEQAHYWALSDRQIQFDRKYNSFYSLTSDFYLILENWLGLEKRETV